MGPEAASAVRHGGILRKRPAESEPQVQHPHKQLKTVNIQPAPGSADPSPPAVSVKVNSSALGATHSLSSSPLRAFSSNDDMPPALQAQQRQLIALRLKEKQLEECQAILSAKILQRSNKCDKLEELQAKSLARWVSSQMTRFHAIVKSVTSQQLCTGQMPAVHLEALPSVGLQERQPYLARLEMEISSYCTQLAKGNRTLQELADVIKKKEKQLHVAHCAWQADII